MGKYNWAFIGCIVGLMLVSGTATGAIMATTVEGIERGRILYVLAWVFTLLCMYQDLKNKVGSR